MRIQGFPLGVMSDQVNIHAGSNLDKYTQNAQNISLEPCESSQGSGRSPDWPLGENAVGSALVWGASSQRGWLEYRRGSDSLLGFKRQRLETRLCKEAGHGHANLWVRILSHGPERVKPQYVELEQPTWNTSTSSCLKAAKAHFPYRNMTQIWASNCSWKQFCRYHIWNKIKNTYT